MNIQFCEVDGCRNPAVVHIADQTQERHLCEIHAKTHLNAGTTAGTPFSNTGGSQYTRVVLELIDDGTAPTGAIGRLWEVTVANMIVARLPYGIAEQLGVLPLFLTNNIITVATERLLSPDSLELVRFCLNFEMRAIIVTRKSLRTAIKACYGLFDSPN